MIALEPAEGYTVTVKGRLRRPCEGGGGSSGRRGHEPRIPLQIAQETTRISVNAAAGVVDQTKTEVSQVVRQSQILNLPINGRRVDSYVLLTPAVVNDGPLGLVSFRGIAGGNSFLTDGNDTSNQYYDENAGRTRIFTQISQDAVLEFQVLSSGYSAGFGRASGGIINTVTRSGSNTPYGTAYWFFRNRALNARDPYASVNPPEHRHQAGGSIGGKFVQDKFFYFFNTEIHRRDFPLVASLARPPLFSSAGAFVGTCTASAAQCSTALGFLNRQFQVLDRTADSELLFGKLDWLPSQNHRISASFNYLRWNSPNGYQTQAVLNDGSGVGNNGNSSVRTRYGRLEWMYIPDGARINELRFGWFKDRHADNFNPNLIPSTGLRRSSSKASRTWARTRDLPRIDPSENRFQVADNLTVVSSRHSWKFGFDFLNTRITCATCATRTARTSTRISRRSRWISAAIHWARATGPPTAALSAPRVRSDGARLQPVHGGPVPRQFAAHRALRAALRIFHAAPAQACQSGLSAERPHSLGGHELRAASGARAGLRSRTLRAARRLRDILCALPHRPDHDLFRGERARTALG